MYFRQVLLVLLLACHSAFADVAKVDDGKSATGFLSGATSLDLTLTITSGASCLVAFLHTDATVSSASIVWDSAGANQTLTSRGSIDNGQRIEVFVLANATAGASKTLHAAWTTGSDAILGAVTFSGADTTTCIDPTTATTNMGTSTGPTIDVTSSADGATAAAAGALVNVLSTDTQTQLYLDNSNSAASSASYGLGNASNTHTWTINASSDWAAIGVHVIVPAAAGGGGDCGRMLGVFRC